MVRVALLLVVIYGFRTYKCIPVSFYHVLSSVERQKILAHPLNMVILLSKNGVFRGINTA